MRFNSSKATETILQRKSNIGNGLAFTTLLLLVLSQNKDWSNSGFLWWGSIAFFMIAYFFSGNAKILLDEKYALWIVSFVALCFISIFWAVRTGLVIESMKSMVVHVAVAFLLRGRIRNNEDIRKVINIVVISIVINSVYLLISNKGMYATQPGFDDKTVRLGTEGDWNANGIGSLTSTATLLSLYFLKEVNSKRQKVMYVAVIILTVLVTLMTGSRTAFIKVLLGIACFLFLTSRGKRLKMTLIILLILCVMYYLVMEIPFFYSIIGWRMEGLTNLFTGEGQVDHSAQIRNEFIYDAIAQWKKEPIFGYGIDCYRVVNTVKANYYAHNNFVELLADLGVIGFAVYYGGYFYCFKKLLSMKNNDNLKWLFLTFLIIIMISDYGAVSYNNLLNHVSLMLMFAYIYIYKKQVLKQKTIEEKICLEK